MSQFKKTSLSKKKGSRRGLASARRAGSVVQSAKRTQSSRSDTMPSTGSGGGSGGPSLLATEEDAASLSSPQTIGRVSEGIETPTT